MVTNPESPVFTGRCERIRTSDPFLPKEVRYQAAPHTDSALASSQSSYCVMAVNLA